jgi:formiminoglutamase
VPELEPPDVAAPATAAGDPRVGHLLGSALGPGEAPRAALLGFPVDEGVRRNGGRPGAAQGPRAIRQALYRLTPDAFGFEVHAALLTRTRDLGDLRVTGDLEADQAALGQVLAGLLRAGTFPVVLGGGHEAAYGHFLGYVEAGTPVEILNIDAHADVRETGDGRGHSGSPFRQALLHPSGTCRRYRVAGLQPQAVAREHLAFLEARGGRGFPAAGLDEEEIRALLGDLRGPALVTFDIDAVDQASAPGVSAPATRGLPAALWLGAAFLAGSTPAVTSADLCETSPPFDRDGQTARLAALTVWEILRGLAARPGRS